MEESLEQVLYVCFSVLTTKQRLGVSVHIHFSNFQVTSTMWENYVQHMERLMK
jgi:hypothetical protein